MREAHAAGAGLVHFPEAALSGYVKSDIRDWADVDWDVVHAELASIADLAGELALWTVIGCNRRLTAPNLPHNSLFVISDTGEIVTRYDKRFCSNSELNGWYTPGLAPCVFEAGDLRFGCALCIEIHFPELFLDYGARGVDCLLFSANDRDPIFWTMAQAYAAANNFWVSMATPAQCGKALASGVAGPNGAPLARAEADDTPQVLVTTLDTADPAFDVALTKARPWRRLARQGGIYDEKRVDDPRSRIRTGL